MQYLKKLLHKMNVLGLSKMHFIQKTAPLVCLVLIALTNSLSCADEGADLQSFLEKNDGTEWLLLNDDLTVYIRFNNNEINLIEQWSYDKEFDCYEYDPNIFTPGDSEIKENSIDKLMIEGDVILSDYETMSFSVQDNILRVDIKLCEWQEERFLPKNIV